MRGVIRRTVLPSTAALALIAAGMVAVSGPALAADTATINGATTYQTMAGFSPSGGAGLTILGQQRRRPTGFTLNGTACSL